jgi:hypothetical protein
MRTGVVIFTSLLLSIFVGPGNARSGLPAFNSGSVSSYASLNAAVGDLGESGAIVVDSVTALEADLTIPPNMRVAFANSGSIDLKGYTLTVNGSFEAGLYKVFSGGGKVTFGSGPIKEVYPQWWYDGGESYTYALQSAIDTGKKVYLAEGTYRFTALRIQNSYTHITGAGMGRAILQFTPSGDSTAILVQAATAIPIIRGSIRDLTILTYDTIYTKTAINMVDANEWTLENLEIKCPSSTNVIWTGGSGSIGIKFNGREMISAYKLYIAADRPVVFGPCPNKFLGVDIGIDHFSGMDWYLIANNYPNIEILPNTPVSNFNLGGSQAWVSGTYGLRWYNNISVPISFSVHISNVRWEQRQLDSSGNPGWMIDIEYPSSNVRNVMLENLFCDPAGNGIKLRNVMWCTIRNYIYASNTLSSLDVDRTDYPLVLENCLGESGSTASIVGLTETFYIPHASMGSSLPVRAVYDKPQVSDISIPSGSAVAITNGASFYGIVSITTDQTPSILYFATGANGTLFEIAHSASGWFSAKKDNAGTINTYLGSDGYWYIQNMTSVNPIKVGWQSLGQYFAPPSAPTKLRFTK